MTVTPEAPRAPAGPLEIRPDALTAAVREMLADREAIRAGRVRLLTMQAVRTRLGRDWPKLADRVQEAARHAIRRHLDSGDRYLEAGEACYILLFAQVDPEVANFRCAAVVQEVLTRLFGEEAAADPHFLALIGAHTATLRVEPGILDNAGSAFDWLERQLETEAPIPAAAEPRRDEADADYDRYFSWAQGIDRTLLPERLSWRFRPIWDAPREAITTYACEVESARDRDGRPIDTRWIYAQAEDPRIGHLDAQMLARVAMVLHEISSGRQPILISSSLHYHTLDTKLRRQAYLQQFRHLPEDHSRYLTLAVHGLPEGIPGAMAQQLVAELRPHARHLVLRLDLATSFQTRLRPDSLRRFRDAGFDGIGFNAADLHRDEAALQRLLEAFGTAASHADLRAFVMGLRSQRTTLAALEAGFQFIHSDAIAAPVAKPSYMYRYTRADLAAGRHPSIDAG